MIRSMNGFGRCQKTVSGMDITVELKSVNHRYFEFSCRTLTNSSRICRNMFPEANWTYLFISTRLKKRGEM